MRFNVKVMQNCLKNDMELESLSIDFPAYFLAVVIICLVVLTGIYLKVFKKNK